MCEGSHPHAHDSQPLAPVIPLPPPPIPVVAVCGKGGVGKTAFSALLAREILAVGKKPLLLIDADPAGGLVSTLHERSARTLAEVREQVIKTARLRQDGARLALADQIDYLLLEALAERGDYSILPMGHSTEKSCFCPVNKLLRSAISQLIDNFSCILIDAEAGIEQINRQVTENVSLIIAVVDGSVRSLETLTLITRAAPMTKIGVVANRIDAFSGDCLHAATPLLGIIPDDLLLRQFDRDGRSLWELPPESIARQAAGAIARQLIKPAYSTITTMRV